MVRILEKNAVTDNLRCRVFIFFLSLVDCITIYSMALSFIIYIACYTPYSMYMVVVEIVYTIGTKIGLQGQIGLRVVHIPP